MPGSSPHARIKALSSSFNSSVSCSSAGMSAFSFPFFLLFSSTFSVFLRFPLSFTLSTTVCSSGNQYISSNTNTNRIAMSYHRCQLYFPHHPVTFDACYLQTQVVKSMQISDIYKRLTIAFRHDL
jgi:hypothetical protein